MATIVHLEGDTFSINLDQIIGFDKVSNSKSPTEVGFHFIRFKSIAGENWNWKFESEEHRDKVFLGLVHMDKGRVFKPFEEKGFGADGPIFS